MDYLRINAKNAAKKLIKANLLKSVVALLIVTLPTFFISAIPTQIITFFTKTDSITPVLIAFVLQIILAICVAPLEFGAMKALYNLFKNETVDIADVFYYFQSKERIVRAFKLLFCNIYYSIVFLVQFLLIPFLILIFSVLIPSDNVLSELLIILTLVSYVVGAFFFYIKAIALSICIIIPISNDELPIKATIKPFLAYFKNKKSELFVFSFSFLGLSLLAALLSLFTLGISAILYNAYYTLSTIIFAKYHYDIFINGGTNEQ